MNLLPAIARHLAPLLAVVSVGLGSPAWAAEALPAELEGVTVVERLGEQVNPELVFTDHTGETVRMADLLEGDIPVLLTLNYYTCETLCSFQLNALLTGLHDLDWTAGERFRIVTVSIDPKETADLAAAKRSSYLDEYGRGEVDWRFLVGDAEQVEELARTVGFGFKYDPRTGQYAHPAVLTFLSPDGTVSRYVYGATYEARDLRFALMEAAAGRLGSPVDKLILSCFRYDETVGRYTPFAFGVMRLGGVATLVVMTGLGIVLWRRERTRPDRSET